MIQPFLVDGRTTRQQELTKGDLGMPTDNYPRSLVVRETVAHTRGMYGSVKTCDSEHEVNTYK